MNSIEMEYVASEGDFDEEGYLHANPDVAKEVHSGSLESGKVHFNVFGKAEKRKIYAGSKIIGPQKRKIERLEGLFRVDMERSQRRHKPDFLSLPLRELSKISDTSNVSSNSYDGDMLDIVNRFADGLVLDCGAGRRSVYYENVVNYEIVDYDTTDVIGVGEELPFIDGSFDAVISVAVLEHVRDPFRCAKEIARVLKPGGQLFCCVPFLQPEHGYPHHYYNMAPQGLRALWEDMLVIDEHKVSASTLPVWTLCWFLKSWAEGLDGEALNTFKELKIGDIIAATPLDMLKSSWVVELSMKKNMELASATIVRAHKA